MLLDDFLPLWITLLYNFQSIYGLPVRIMILSRCVGCLCGSCYYVTFSQCVGYLCGSCYYVTFSQCGMPLWIMLLCDFQSVWAAFVDHVIM